METGFPSTQVGQTMRQNGVPCQGQQYAAQGAEEPHLAALDTAWCSSSDSRGSQQRSESYPKVSVGEKGQDAANALRQ